MAAHIDRLILQIPGLTKDQARTLGAEVADRLAERLPEDVRSRQLGALNVRLTLPATTPRDQLAGPIVDAIIEALR